MRRLFALTLLPSLLGAAGPVPAHGEIVERIIAKVNGEIITLTEFQERQVAAAQQARVTPDEIGTFLRQNNARLLQEAIDEILLIQEAENLGLSLPEEFVDEIIESIKQDNKIESEEQFQMALAQEGLTLDELRERVRKSSTRRMIIQRNVEPKIAVSEEELQEEYETRKDTDFTRPATVTLREIAISDEAGGLRLAQEIVERARANEDFATLARTHSASPSAESGGDLGEIAQGDLSPELEDVAFSLSVGEVSDPIRIGEGYRILKLAARTSGSVIPYATAKDQLRNTIMASRFQDAYDAFMAELREGQDIELRVREVPLRIEGGVPDATLFEGVDPFSMMGPGADPGAGPGVPAPGAQPAGPVPSSTRYGTPAGEDDEISTTPQARPDRIVPGSILEDEVSITPQAAPERVVPGVDTSAEQPESPPPPE